MVHIRGEHANHYTTDAVFKTVLIITYYFINVGNLNSCAFCIRFGILLTYGMHNRIIS